MSREIRAELSAKQFSSRIPTYLTVKQFAAKHPAFPEGGLRHRIFHADKNGLTESGAITRNGGRVLIDEERFFSWVQEGSK